MPRQKLPPVKTIDPSVLTVVEFCAAHKISIDMFFKLARQGEGPRVMKVGTRTLISQEAAAEWRRERERIGDQHCTAKGQEAVA